MARQRTSLGAALAGRLLAALVAGFFGAESLAADTIRGQVTRCGEAVAGVKVFAFVTVEEGFKTDLKPCTVITEKVSVGSDTTDGGGRYSFTFARPVADEDACRFVLKGASVEFRDGTSNTLLGRSAVKAFVGANTTFDFNLAIDCPPPPPPVGEPVTVSGNIKLCGDPAAGFQVRAVTDVRVGIDQSEFGGKPCEISSPTLTVVGTTTVAGDGSFSIRFNRPIDDAPEETCAFIVKVFIQLLDPSTGRILWLSSSRLIGLSTVFNEDICKFFVAASVKVVTSAAGRRPSDGHFITDAQIERAISQANTVLSNNDAGWRLFLTEIVNVAQPQYLSIGDDHVLREMERDARASPGAFAWRSDAVNFYVVDDLRSGGGTVGGICSFPANSEIIAINNSGGILNGGVGWLHELGHYLSLVHTFECFGADCGEETCSGEGAFHAGRRVSCPDNCPDDTNVMSYYSFDVEDAELGSCQKREMDFELFDAEGSRSAVLRRVLPFESSLPRILLDLSTFRRGDSNASGTVDISDALNTLGTLLLGTGAIPCADAADANDDGRVDISDAVATLSVLFLGSNLIPPPGTDHCSPDGTEDALPFCAYSETLCPASTNKGSDPF